MPTHCLSGSDKTEHARLLASRACRRRGGPQQSAAMPKMEPGKLAIPMGGQNTADGGPERRQCSGYGGYGVLATLSANERLHEYLHGRRNSPEMRGRMEVHGGWPAAQATPRGSDDLS